MKKSVEVLITTMHLRDVDSLVKKMNIQSSFVIGNQCDADKMESVVCDGKQGMVLSRNEKGVGKNRNVVMDHAEADICVFADDDMVFYDGYVDKVASLFEQYRKADLIIFNLGDLDSIGYEKERKNRKVVRVNQWNYMNYGAARIAFRRQIVSYLGIRFNLNFGGGTQHQAGEDTLFLKECLDKGLNILAVPVSIAYLSNDRESSWFHGYNEKYFFDKGVFLSVAYGKLAIPMGAALLARHSEYMSAGMSKTEVFRSMYKGIRYISEELHEVKNRSQKTGCRPGTAGHHL